MHIYMQGVTFVLRTQRTFRQSLARRENDNKELATASVAIAALSGIAVPAASASAGECGGGLVCIFNEANFGGFLGSRGPGIGIMNVSRNANDKMSSWINNTGGHAAWYQHANGGGKCHTMTPFSNNNYVGWWSNDTLTSWRTNRGC